MPTFAQPIMIPSRHNPAPRRSSPGPTGRRGGTTLGLLVTLSVIGLLTVTAVVFTPGRLIATPRSPAETVKASHPAHQRTIELLGSLIRRSKQVLALHQRGATPYLELVLWLEDVENPGRIDPGEIAILSHSEVLQTVNFYALDEEAQQEGGLDPTLRALVGGAPETPKLPTSDIAHPDFCNEWRTLPGIAQRVVATHVADMLAHTLGTSESGKTLLRIALTWTGDSSDPPDEAALLLDVVMRPGGAR